MCRLATVWHLAELRLIVMHLVVRSVCALHLVLSDVSGSAAATEETISVWERRRKKTTRTLAHWHTTRTLLIAFFYQRDKLRNIRLGGLHPIVDAALTETT